MAFYARVSTERQQRAQTSEQQVSQLQTSVSAQDGWEVRAEHIFRDDGARGAKLDRPGLDTLRDQAALATFDLVLITSPERLAHKYVDQVCRSDDRVGGVGAARHPSRLHRPAAE